jgi:pimeloyl-ACP methyl ester carboxylesterase
MNMFVRVSAVLLLGIGLLFGLSRVGSAAAAAPVFKQRPCDDLVLLPPDFDASRLTCGSVTVLEDPDRVDSREIEIVAAVIRARGGASRPDPVVFLPGGPGQSSVDFLAFTEEWYTEATGDRDLIGFDFRGTGYSEKLACEELDRLFVDSIKEQWDDETYEARDAAAQAACLGRYAADGADLRQYHSAAIAHDMVQVMTALGYEKWNLIGGSYGTRLALTAMRDFPERIRSAVLDAPAPPGLDVDIERARWFETKLKELWAACAADAECGAAYPRIEETFWDLVRRLNIEPLTVPATPPDSTGTFMVDVDGYAIINGTFTALSDTAQIPLIPFAIDDIARGNTGVLSQVVSSQLFVDYGIATGMFYSVQCNEEWPFYDADDVRRATRGVRPEVIQAMIGTSPEEYVDSTHEFCEMWNAPIPDRRESRPVVSSVPALILAGEFDTNTPTEFGEAAAATLANSRVIEVPASGHFVSYSQRACTNGLIAAFIAAPDRAPDETCVRAIPPPDFVVSGEEVPGDEPPPPPPPEPAQPSPSQPGGTITAPDTGTGPPPAAPEPVPTAFALLAAGATLVVAAAGRAAWQRARRSLM